MSALRLYTLNAQRAALVVDDFIQKSGAAASTAVPVPVPPLLAPHEAAARERVWRPFLSWLRGEQPVMGARVGDLVGASPADVAFLLRRVYPHERYLLTAHPTTARVLVLFRQGAGAQDELKAFFQARALRHLYPEFHVLVQQERAKLLDPRSSSSSGGGDGRRWPTPAVTKALLASYEMTVHRFTTFLRCLEPAATPKDDADGAGVGQGRREDQQDEGWTVSRVNLGTSGWRLLAEGEEKKDK